MPFVFAPYQSAAVGLARVWSESWAARGWDPKLISAREIKEFATKERAARRRGGGRMSDLRVINFSFPAPGRRRAKITNYGRRGWEDAALVRFPASASEVEVRGCGRCL